jgi:hypothetical protein
MVSVMEKLDEAYLSFERTGHILRNSGVAHKDSSNNHKNTLIVESRISTSSEHIQQLYKAFNLLFEKTTRNPISSYSLKHMVEGLPSIPYITNGEFILVAQTYNCKINIMKSDCLNVDIYIKSKVDFEAMKNILNVMLPRPTLPILANNDVSLDPQAP